jgi:hypothetical protein
MSFTPLDKSASPSWANESKNNSSFTNTDKSHRIFGDLTFDEIGALSFEDTINGKAVGDYTFDDPVYSTWSNAQKS